MKELDSSPGLSHSHNLKDWDFIENIGLYLVYSCCLLVSYPPSIEPLPICLVWQVPMLCWLLPWLIAYLIIPASLWLPCFVGRSELLPDWEVSWILSLSYLILILLVSMNGYTHTHTHTVFLAWVPEKIICYQYGMTSVSDSTIDFSKYPHSTRDIFI